MTTGPLVMLKHARQGWVPATEIRGFNPIYGPYMRWPEPTEMWHLIYRDRWGSEIIGWIKRTSHGRQVYARSGHNKLCELCGKVFYVTMSTEKKKYCSSHCRSVVVGRERLKGLVF